MELDVEPTVFVVCVLSLTRFRPGRAAWDACPSASRWLGRDPFQAVLRTRNAHCFRRSRSIDAALSKKSHLFALSNISKLQCFCHKLGSVRVMVCIKRLLDSPSTAYSTMTAHHVNITTTDSATNLLTPLLAPRSAVDHGLGRTVHLGLDVRPLTSSVQETRECR